MRASWVAAGLVGVVVCAAGAFSGVALAASSAVTLTGGDSMTTACAGSHLDVARTDGQNVTLSCRKAAASPSPAPSASPSATAKTYTVPATIASNGSQDVTAALLSFIASVPNGSIIRFAAGGRYRVDGTLTIQNRSNLTFDGQGAEIFAGTVGSGTRAHWRLVYSSNLAIRNMTITGANPHPGVHNYTYEWQHGISAEGTLGLDISNVTIRRVYGDCLYLGHWNGRWSAGISMHDSVCAGNGRMGVAVTAGRDSTFTRNTFSGQAYTVFDVEPETSSAGWQGGSNLTFSSNRVNAASGDQVAHFFTASGPGPIDHVYVSNNTVVGMRYGTWSESRSPAGLRRSTISYTGNSGDIPFWGPDRAVFSAQNVDGLTVTGNSQPVTASQNMVFVGACSSTGLAVSSNVIPGGVGQERTGC